MNKSSVSRSGRRQKNQKRRSAPKILSDEIIAENWNDKQTLAQNYSRLGIVAKLQTPAGGVQQRLGKPQMRTGVVKARTILDDDDSDDSDDNNEDSEVENEFDSAKIPRGEARIRRDAQGNVIEVIYGTMDENDEQTKDDESERDPSVVKKLEERASRPIIRKKRELSEREEAWMHKLYKKHGDNVDNMFRDTKLNIYQQSRGDLQKRLEKWKSQNPNLL